MTPPLVEGALRPHPRWRATASRSSRSCAGRCPREGPCWRSRAAPASMPCISPRRCRDLTWQPTDADTDALRSISAHRTSAQLPNLLSPLELDAAAPVWPVMHADAVVAINMIHIRPGGGRRTDGGRRARASRPAAPLYLYGPFKEGDRHTAPSNAAFDANLRASNPEWGVRDLEQVADLARGHGLHLVERVAMPANNLSLVFRRGHWSSAQRASIATVKGDGLREGQPSYGLLRYGIAAYSLCARLARRGAALPRDHAAVTPCISAQCSQQK